MATNYDSLHYYLQEMGRYPLLSHEEEIELARQAKAGSLRAKQRMIECNLRLVVSIAKKHQNRGLPLLDLIQEGSIGLSTAVDKFEIAQGCRFSTYAYWWIRQGITAALRAKSRPIYLPQYQWEMINKIKKHYRELNQKLGREPSLSELSESTEIKPKTINLTLQLFQKISSLDQPVGPEQKDSLLDLLPGDNQPTLYMESLQRDEQLFHVMAHLDERERLVLSQRYGLEDDQPKSMREIGEQIGLSHEGIRLILKKIMKKLERYAESA
ncbi:sigma-70 family RNA polymerase sigma factor [Acaryochloris marina]|uniref:RNA polymerase sigma-70 factor n=1 Tax=Acaryochloris marina (strain MBIC 11017) TaxID=329726 RepID=A8ZM44_ACAM1|nr:sigma-70 family RNA polymerase sigma factor [Acaryochloris marina]ABW31813.1 RNA polymerase sigma-70 factor [Acaryochloris marina MBIC11017]BDM83000.1 RNA polymerase sigma factor SigA [Acaryochloris marina MBIC10699]